MAGIKGKDTNLLKYLVQNLIYNDPDTIKVVEDFKSLAPAMSRKENDLVDRSFYFLFVCLYIHMVDLCSVHEYDDRTRISDGEYVKMFVFHILFTSLNIVFLCT